MTIEQYPSSNNIATTTVWKYTATGSELALSGYDNYSQALQFTAGSEQVYLNGVLLVRNLDYTPAANGLSITFPTSLAYNDFVQIYCYSNYSIASVASSSITGLIQNAQLSNSSITIGNQSISLGNAITTLTGTSISGSTNTLTNIPNSALSNSSIIINGNPISLGGTVNITTPNTILSQKGGLIVGTGGGSVTQFIAGTNGSYLIPDSTQTSGLNWAGPQTSAGKNYVLNGAFDSWQKGPGPFAYSSFLADRWFTTVNIGSSASTVIQSTDVPNLQYKYSANFNVNANITSGNMGECAFRQFFDLQTVRSLVGKSTSVSFWYKSNLSGTHKARFATYNNGGVGFSDLTSTFSYTTIGTWQYITIPNLSPFLSVISWDPTYTDSSFCAFFDVGPNNGTTLSSTTYFRMTGVQIEEGLACTQFSRNGGQLQGELTNVGSASFDGVLVSTNALNNAAGSGTNGWGGYQVAGKNHIIGGSMENWQRGITGLTNYTCDRFQVNTGTWAQSTDVPTGFSYSLSTATSPLSGWLVQHAVELPATGLGGPYVGLYTISFYAKFAAGSTMYWAAWFADGIGGGNQVTVSDYTGTTSPAKFVGTGSWQRYSYTVNIQVTPSGTNKVLRLVWLDLTGTNLTGGFKMTGVQFEQGGTATAFARAGGTLDGELRACQRYYFTDSMNKHLCFVRDPGLIFFSKDFPVTMRKIPIFSNNLTTKVGNGSFPGTAGQIGFYGNGWITTSATALSALSDGSTPTTGAVYITGFSVTVGQVLSLQDNDLSYFAWDAEF
jgi:hypothetical protein